MSLNYWANMLEEKDIMAEAIPMWNYVSDFIFVWIGSVTFIVISVMLLVGASFGYDVVSLFRNRQPSASGSRLPAIEKPSSASSAASESSLGSAGSSGRKGAKWKKSSKRAAERRQRQAKEGHLPKPYATIFSRARSAPPSECDFSSPAHKSVLAAYGASLSDPNNVKRLTNSISDLDSSSKAKFTTKRSDIFKEDKDTSKSPGGGLGPQPPMRSCDCAYPPHWRLGGHGPPAAKDEGGTAAVPTAATTIPLTLPNGDTTIGGTTISIPANGAVIVVYTSAGSYRQSSDSEHSNLSVEYGASNVEAEESNNANTIPVTKHATGNMQIVFLSDGKNKNPATVQDGDVKKSKESLTMCQMNFPGSTDPNLDVQRFATSWNPAAVINLPNKQFVMTSLMPQVHIIPSMPSKDPSKTTTALMPKESLTHIKQSSQPEERNANEPQELISITPQEVGYKGSSASDPISTPDAKEKIPAPTTPDLTEGDGRKKDKKKAATCCGGDKTPNKGGGRCQCALIKTSKKDPTSHSSLIKITDIMLNERDSEPMPVSEKVLLGVATCLLSEPSRPPLAQIPQIDTELTSEETKSPAEAATVTIAGNRPRTTEMPTNIPPSAATENMQKKPPAKDTTSKKSISTKNPSVKSFMSNDAPNRNCVLKDSPTRTSTPKTSNTRIPNHPIFKPYLPSDFHSRTSSPKDSASRSLSQKNFAHKRFPSK